MISESALIRNNGAQRAEGVLNASMVLLSVALLVRGAGVHLPFAAFTAVAVPTLLRTALGLLLYEHRCDTRLASG